MKVAPGWWHQRQSRIKLPLLGPGLVPRPLVAITSISARDCRLFCGLSTLFLLLSATMTGAAEPTTSPAEIAIIGGGPSGLSLAGILERAGMSYVIYEKYARDEIPLGGCLDMHKGSGHAAMEQAGCYAEFRKYGRLGPATIHQVWAHSGHEVFAWGEGKDAPELDRFQIKKALLTTVPDARIRWHTGLLKAERDSQGKIVLHLSDGTTATGFKLVVGADGTWSKVRSLVRFCLDGGKTRCS